MFRYAEFRILAQIQPYVTLHYVTLARARSGALVRYLA